MTTPTTQLNGLNGVDIDVNLPELPPPLKHLAPYIQRAIELKKKDPVMCYWCLYFTAKQGVAAKGGKDTRPFLYAVLGLLEKTKAALAPHSDAVASDEAGSAYIQNFALRVFNMADNEDRKGKASKSTAKKFLAAANFLELLTVFDVQDQTENEQKIRYSKWKAADIAKAIREGRQPTPGPAGSSFEESMAGPSQLSVVSEATSPTSSGLAPPTDSVFGSVPGSISASLTTSPYKNASQLPTHSLSPTPKNDTSLPETSGDDITPVTSPRQNRKALSPERNGSRSESRSTSPPQSRISPSQKSKPLGGSPPLSKAVPQTPTNIRSTLTVGTAGGAGLKPGASPGAWSSAATPGLDERGTGSVRGTPMPGSSFNGVNKPKPATGFLSKLMAAAGASGAAANTNASSSSSSSTFKSNGDLGDTSSNSTNANGATGARSYVVEEPADDDSEHPVKPDVGDLSADNDSSGSGSRSGDHPLKGFPPVHPSHLAGFVSSGATGGKRQDSWSSTFAERGEDTPGPSRSSSFAIPPISEKTEDDDDDVGDFTLPSVPLPDTPGGVVLPSAPTFDTLLPSVPGSTEYSEEASDSIAPLPSIPSVPTSKKVHFTPSVVGGLSSAASSSAPSSPSGTFLSLGSRVPLPPSTDSDETASVDTEGPDPRRFGDASLVSKQVEPEEPTQVYEVPLPGVPSVISAGSNGTNGHSPHLIEHPASPPLIPLLPTVPDTTSSSRNHSRTPSADVHWNGTPPGSLSPRLRATNVPPITSSAHLHQHSSSLGGSGGGLPHSRSSSGSGSSGGTSSPLPPRLPPAPPPHPSNGNGNSNGNGTSASKGKYYPPTPYANPRILSPPTSASASALTSPAPPLETQLPSTQYVVTPLPETLDAEETNRAKKHAKFAMSALDYDDLDTARRELVRALAVLGVNVQL